MAWKFFAAAEDPPVEVDNAPPPVTNPQDDGDDDDSELDGGSAFPRHKDFVWKGMTMREYFAGQALIGLIVTGAEPQWAAVQAFQYADHMVKVGECPEEDDDDDDES